MRELVEQVNFRGHHKRKVTTVGGYSLAKKRNIGQVSAEALVLAVAGDALNGGLTQAEFGFDGVKLDGRGTQADMPLWDDVFRADGGPPVMEVNCQHGQGDDKDPSLSTAEMRAHLGAWVVVSSLLTFSHDVNNDTTIDQGQCESCWAFLSSGDVEDRPGPMRILLGILVVWRY